MNSAIRQKLKQAIAGVALFCTVVQPTLAAVVVPNRIQLSSEPLFLGTTVIPKVMLTISKDQQLFKKAYNDYSDLDGDGVIETTYKHSIPYYGYFDSRKCYVYSTTNGRFEPSVDNSNADDTHGLCAAGTAWHGNFLNWLSMSRMDAVRKLLYGGMRSTDGTTTGETVLERAYIPPDAHAWAKYYNPAAPGSTAAEQPAINRLTPFDPSTAAATSTNQTINSVRLPNTTTDVAMSITAALATNPNATVGIKDPIFNISSAPAGVSLGDQLRISKATGSVTGAVKAISGNNYTLSVNPASIIGTGTGSGSWTVTNLSSTGISFCNMTPGTSGDDTKSQTNTQAPQIRVVRGNYALWSSNERFQCLWRHERSALLGGFDTQPGSNGNHAVLSGIDASAENPDRSTHALSTVASVNGEYIARVQACASNALIVGEKCKIYGAAPAVLKPFGLLQEYGDDDRIHFGLTTGSFTNNTNGGVLRKNIKSFTDEVNTNNGTFSNANHYRPPNAPRSQGTTPLTVEGIVNSLNYMRIYGYNYGSNYNEGTYLGGSGDNCDFQLTDITPGNCTSWGNPIAEVFFDSLRYFANQAPVYTLPDSSKDNVLGLPKATRADPMANTLYCAKMNVLVFNASVSTNEDDLRAVTVSSINGGAGASNQIHQLTTNVGNNEGITAAAARKFFAGQIFPAAGGGDFQLCTAKTVNALGDALGICPEGPTLLGSYFIGGLAHHAKTTRIRTPGSLPVTVPAVPAGDTSSLKVTSYGIQLATNTPELVIPIPGLAGRRVVIQPIYRLDNGTTSFGGGALVDMKFVSQTSDATTGIATGKVYVNWEDSEQGGDYDQDMWGTISWVLDRNANTMTVTTHAISSSTGGARQGFGFTISGTTQDGPHFFSGLIGFNYTDTVTAQPANVAGCSNCRADSDGAAGQKGAQTATFTLSATSAGESLKDPLWYLAKYGGFNDLDENGLPGAAAEWDTRLADGTSCTVATCDGVPDNYFQVTNPLGLEAALRAAFDAVTRNATATSVASNTTSLQVGSTIYVARFDPKDWSGNLEALPINADGTLGSALWNAQEQLSAVTPGSRDIYTYNDTSPTIDAANGRRGTRFLWTNAGGLVIPPSLETYLNTSPVTGTADSQGQQRLNYLRGNRSQETSKLKYRKRDAAGPLGDIINSNPLLVTEPRANIFDLGYRTFKETPAIQNRTHMVYVAANDGMLHGFNAITGQELIAYVPSKTFPHLNKLTNPAYVHRSYVDGSPEVADACVGAVGSCTWKSVLVGALGGGGQGLYALDVSNPATFGSASAQSLVMWEFNDTDDADLGFITSQPVIRKMADGRWAAIVSGGYNTTDADGSASATGNAHLFIIFLGGPSGANRTWLQGTDYIKIDTGIGFATSAGLQPNGLARPLAADTDANGQVNFIYAGDLQGNLWKFNVSSADTTMWTQPSSLVRLFTAVGPGGAQPITAQAEGALHPGGKGFIINFGTGKYLESSDTNAAGFTIQSFYGIWDKNDSVLVNAQTRVTARNQLLQQVLTDTTVSGRTVRTIQLDPITGKPKVPNWSSVGIPPSSPASDSPPKHMGWYMDFPNGVSALGERAVFTPLLIGGRLIFTTVIPSTDPCQFGGSSFLMVVDPASGGPFDTAVVDINGDGVLNTTDRTSGASPQYVSGLQSEVGITNTPRVVTRPPDPGPGGSVSNILGTSDPRTASGVRQAFAILAGSSGSIVSPTIALLNQSPRISWREVLKD